MVRRKWFFSKMYERQWYGGTGRYICELFDAGGLQGAPVRNTKAISPCDTTGGWWTSEFVDCCPSGVAIKTYNLFLSRPMQRSIGTTAAQSQATPGRTSQGGHTLCPRASWAGLHASRGGLRPSRGGLHASRTCAELAACGLGTTNSQGLCCGSEAQRNPGPFSSRGGRKGKTRGGGDQGQRGARIPKVQNGPPLMAQGSCGLPFVATTAV